MKKDKSDSRHGEIKSKRRCRWRSRISQVSVGPVDRFWIVLRLISMLRNQVVIWGCHCDSSWHVLSWLSVWHFLFHFWSPQSLHEALNSNHLSAGRHPPPSRTLNFQLFVWKLFLPVPYKISAFQAYPSTMHNFLKPRVHCRNEVNPRLFWTKDNTSLDCVSIASRFVR